jgi:hypothetical protein
MNTTLSPISVDFSTIRENRQRNNNNHVYNIIKSKNIQKLKQNCNIKALTRLLDDYNIDIEELLEECEKNNLLAKITSSYISINASRQGTSDETLQINTCNSITSTIGVNITQLSKNFLRPCKNGTLVNNEQFKKISDKNSCLKSFDAMISGKVQGYIFAKVVYGTGGHQANVFEESYTFAEWVHKFGDPNMLYVILIDTDLTAKFEQLRLTFNGQSNLLVVNHIQLQQYIIDHYN